MNSSSSPGDQPPLTPDLGQARQQLAIIGRRPEAQFSFRACADRCTDIRETRKCYGTLDAGIRQSSGATNGRKCRPAGILEERQRTVGAGAYFVPNELDGHGQLKENVVGTRAAFADADTAEQVRSALRFAEQVPPGLITASGGVDNGVPKLQMFWPTEGCPLPYFTDLQLAIVSRAGTDPAVKDAGHIMRLAGYFHMKCEPRMTQVLYADPRNRYDYHELLARVLAQPQICDPWGHRRPGPPGRRRPGVPLGAAIAGPTARLRELVDVHGGLFSPAVKALIREAKAPTEGPGTGNRHATLVSIAARLIQAGWHDNEIEELVLPIANDTWSDGDWAEHLKSIIKSIWAKHDAALAKIPAAPARLAAAFSAER
jgi:hypothetical protein